MTMNTFEVLSVEYSSVGHLKAMGTPVDPDMDDGDFIAKVIGRCVSGPDDGKKVQSIQAVSQELHSDLPMCDQVTRSMALRAWARLGACDSMRISSA